MSNNTLQIRNSYSTDTENSDDADGSISPNLTRKILDYEDDLDDDNIQNKKRSYKSFSRNALIARANRLKKKRYIENLEKEVFKLRNENGKLKSALTNKSRVIENLRKEIKYVKGVLANNSDIMKLLKAINGSTGMPVTSSINKDFTILNDFTLKNNAPTYGCSNFNSISLLDDDIKPFECDNLFSDYDIPACDANSLDTSKQHLSKSTLMEHNYTLSDTEGSNDGGICLHVSNGRVSLEFCSICQDNSTETWREME